MTENTTKITTEPMFWRTPRVGAVGWLALAAWFVLAAAFVGDLVPTASPAEWLYGVEARRDAHAPRAAHSEVHAWVGRVHITLARGGSHR